MVAFAKFTKATPPPSHLSHVEHYSHVTVVCGTPFHRPVMSTDTTKFRSKLAKLGKSLDELESQLEPLFAQSLPESLLALDTIQQAKLQVIIPYVVYDLVFGKRVAYSTVRIRALTSFFLARSVSEKSRYRSKDTPCHWRTRACPFWRIPYPD